MLKTALTSLVCITAVAVQLHADEKKAPMAPMAPMKAKPCTEEANRSMQVGLRHIEGKGIGYHEGYTTLEGFFAFDPNEYTYEPFIDVRGHVFNDGKWAANGGIGFRTLQSCYVFGLNAYYDYRQEHETNYNELGAGVEFLGKRWEFRANGYFPIGDRKHALDNVDAEVAYHLYETEHWDFLGGVGTYYLWGESENQAWGGKARLFGLFRDFLSLEVSYSYDHLFNNIVQGEIGLYLPFGPRGKKMPTKKSCSSCSDMMDLNDRLVQPVRRQEIIPIKHHHHHDHHHDHHHCD